MKHDKKTITRACKLYNAGIPLREICRRTGIKSTSTIMFACDPEYKAEQIARSYKWRKEHPRKWKKISRAANQRYYAKKKTA